MEAIVLNRSFEQVCMIDTFESFIWTERYDCCGNFEIYTVVDTGLLSQIEQDFYLWLKDSDAVMIIEEIQIQSDIETGNKLTISGRSLESILDRRIIWKQTSFINQPIQNVIKTLIENNVTSPELSYRRINNFIFNEVSGISNPSISIQFTGDNLYDAIEGLCKSFNLGFKVTLNDNNQFVFSLYEGVDRSYDQAVNPYVIFSPKFENLINSNYLESKKTLKNVTLVAGEDEGENRKTVEYDISYAEGPQVHTQDLDRRELYTDARDIRSEVEDEHGERQPLTPEQYAAQLIQRGQTKLAENTKSVAFEGQIDTYNTYEYGVDYGMGDVVQIENEYGIGAKVRITEFVKTQDVNGYEAYPTYSII